MHRQFFKNLLKAEIVFKLFAMIEEIHFILHVENGFHIIIHNVDTLIQIRILIYVCVYF